MLAFKSFNDQKEKTILFLHGGGTAGWMWQPVVDLLTDYHFLVADLPEHGGSREVKPFSMKLAAETCAELVRSQAHGGTASVVGLSEGAQVAVQMLAHAPQVMERAFISSALLLPMPGGKLYSSPGFIGALFRMSVPPFKNNDSWIRLNMKYSAGLPEAYFEQFKADFQSMTESQFVNLMVANQTFRLPQGMGVVDTPTLVVCGAHEYRQMKYSAKLLGERLSRGQIFQLDLGEGSTLAKEHNWALTAPDNFADVVRCWMEDRPIKFPFLIPV